MPVKGGRAGESREAKLRSAPDTGVLLPAGSWGFTGSITIRGAPTMGYRIATLFGAVAVAGLMASGCATEKYVDDRVAELTTKIDGVSGQVASVSARVDQNSNQLAQLSGRMDSQL